MKRSQTRKAELVETDRIARSLARLMRGPMGYTPAWRRALYHALGMSGISGQELAKLREALRLE